MKLTVTPQLRYNVISTTLHYVNISVMYVRMYVGTYVCMYVFAYLRTYAVKACVVMN